MMGSNSVHFEGILMFRRAITSISFPSIKRKSPGKFFHYLVARNFGKDGSRRNGKAEIISPNYGKSLNVFKRGNVFSIYEKRSWLLRKSLNSSFHGEKGGFSNI